MQKENTMASLADFKVSDGSFELGKDQEHVVNFDLESDLLSTDHSAVLTFMVTASGSGTKEFEVDINDETDVFRQTSNSEARAMLEVVDKGLLRVGSNSIQFRMESGTGSLTFSDVVLWYQRNIM
jgi:hypothetical protein